MSYNFKAKKTVVRIDVNEINESKNKGRKKKKYATSKQYFIFQKLSLEYFP